MKRCPQCGRDYTDDTLSFCLDDGEALLDGPASMSEPETVILPGDSVTSESSTRTFDPSDGSSANSGPPDILPSQGFRHLSRSRVIVIAGVGFVIVTLLGLGFFWIYSGASAKQFNSVAVIPFLNESGDNDVEYLSDGITESLISKLSKSPDLSVKASSSVFFYKGKKMSPKQFGKDLKVEAVVLGRFVKRADEIRLHLEIVDTDKESVIWSDEFRRDISDLGSLQDEIGNAVLKGLKNVSLDSEVAQDKRIDPEAERLNMLGRFYLSKRNSKEFAKARSSFESAIKLVPDYAAAYAGLADTYMLMTAYSNTTDPKIYMPLAREAASKAIELDPNVAEAHASLGRVLCFYYREFNAAEAEFKRAIQINPDYATGHFWYSEYLIVTGQNEAALAEIRESLELEPLSLPINRYYANTLMFLGQLRESEEQLKRTEELFPNNSTTLMDLAWLYARQGKFDAASEMAIRAVRTSGKGADEVARFKTAVDEDGWKGYHRVQLELGLEQKRSKPFYRSYDLAMSYTAIGDFDKAFESLDNAILERDRALNYIKLDFAFLPLHNDPRFAEILKNLGLSD